MSKPVGKVRMVSSEMRRPANDKAVFVNILCEDEAGSPFYFAAAAFGFDMKAGFPPSEDRPTPQAPEPTIGPRYCDCTAFCMRVSKNIDPRLCKAARAGLETVPAPEASFVKTFARSPRRVQEARLCRKCEAPLPEHWSFSYCNVCRDQV